MTTEYTEYDEFGLKEVRCMNCNTVVGKRTYTESPSKTEMGEMVNVLVFRQLPNLRHGKKIKIKYGGIRSYIEPIICVECEKLELNEQILIDVAQEGLEREYRKVKGKSKQETKSYFKNKKIELDKEQFNVGYILKN